MLIGGAQQSNSPTVVWYLCAAVRHGQVPYRLALTYFPSGSPCLPLRLQTVRPNVKLACAESRYLAINTCLSSTQQMQPGSPTFSSRGHFCMVDRTTIFGRSTITLSKELSIIGQTNKWQGGLQVDTFTTKQTNRMHIMTEALADMSTAPSGRAVLALLAASTWLSLKQYTTATITKLNRVGSSLPASRGHTRGAGRVCGHTFAILTLGIFRPTTAAPTLAQIAILAQIRK